MAKADARGHNGTRESISTSADGALARAPAPRAHGCQQKIAIRRSAAPDYGTTLVLAIELSNASWVLAAQTRSLSHVKAKRSVKPTTEALVAVIDAFITAYHHAAGPFASPEKKVHRPRFKNRRISQV